jgi:hypothetical protein
MSWERFQDLAACAWAGMLVASVVALVIVLWRSDNEPSE